MHLSDIFNCSCPISGVHARAFSRQGGFVAGLASRIPEIRLYDPGYRGSRVYAGLIRSPRALMPSIFYTRSNESGFDLSYPGERDVGGDSSPENWGVDRPSFRGRLDRLLGSFRA